jgi:hypothetical protein
MLRSPSFMTGIDPTAFWQTKICHTVSYCLFTNTLRRLIIRHDAFYRHPIEAVQVMTLKAHIGLRCIAL